MSEPTEPPAPRRRWGLNLRNNMIAGLLTVIPLFAVWFVLDLLFNLLSDVGRPLIVAFAGWMAPLSPEISAFLLLPKVVSAFAVVAILLLLYLIGLLATFVVGQQLIAWFEAWVARIPFVQTIYGATKQMVTSLQTKPGTQRVVLIEFPHPGMRAIGFVMKSFTDADSGREISAVYVPTTPNPTSGYLELVPSAHLIATDLTMDQAMTMVISGGAVAPDRLHYGTPRPDPRA